jgi:hypothetical protein
MFHVKHKEQKMNKKQLLIQVLATHIFYARRKIELSTEMCAVCVKKHYDGANTVYECKIGDAFLKTDTASTVSLHVLAFFSQYEDPTKFDIIVDNAEHHLLTIDKV